jgi:mannan endo-1,4-beta-mannosidase
MNKIKVYFLALLFLNICILQMAAKSKKCNRYNPKKELLENLMEISKKGIMFGHQDDPVYGIGWNGDSNRSDVKSVCGDYPAVMGFDLGHLELGRTHNLDSVSFDRIRFEIQQQFKRGGMITLSWHLNNPLTGGSSWDISNPNVVKSILKGGEKHDLFISWLDELVIFFKSLKTDKGQIIPVLFRPWHEHTGSWFWWGENFCSPEEYKSLWIMTHDYFESKGVNNLLYAYSPGSEGTDGIYMKKYPGDTYVDLFGLDIYQFSNQQPGEFANQLDFFLAYITKLGIKYNKPIALTETGYRKIPDFTWWTKTLLPVLEKYPISYVLVWRNAHDQPDQHFGPFPTHPSVANFIEFYKNKKTLFCKDIKNELY